MGDECSDDCSLESSKRLERTQSEARIVLDRQYEDLSDMDDAAMRTVRITSLILGVLLSILQLSGSTDTELSFNKDFAVISGAFFILTIVAGVLTYNLSSNIITGPSSDYIQRLTDGAIEKPNWQKDLLAKYQTWIHDNDTVIGYNSRALFVTHSLLISALSFAGLAVADGLSGINWVFTLVLVIVPTLLIILFSFYFNLG